MTQEIQLELRFIGDKHSIDAELFNKVLSNYFKLVREVDKNLGRNKISFELDAFDRGSFVSKLRIIFPKGWQSAAEYAAVLTLITTCIPEPKVQNTTINNIVYNTKIQNIQNDIFYNILKDDNIEGLELQINGDTCLISKDEMRDRIVANKESRNLSNIKTGKQDVWEVEKDGLITYMYSELIKPSQIKKEIRVVILDIPQDLAKGVWKLDFEGIIIDAILDPELVDVIPYDYIYENAKIYIDLEIRILSKAKQKLVIKRIYQPVGIMV